jgi:hypothetical protein
MKTLLATAALAIFAFAGSANAAEMKMACDDASFAMVMKSVDGAKGDAKEMGMKELDMAKMAMTEKKADDCMMHLEMADKAVMKK